MKRLICIVSIALAVNACTPEDYKRSADLQVDQLLKDREQRTLDYVPKAEAKSTTPTELTKTSYATIPTTPIPPPNVSPIEPRHEGLPFGPLGPEKYFSSDVELPNNEPMTIDQARQPGIEQLRLGPPASLGNAPTMDLFQAIEYAVQHSRDYQSEMEDLYLVALDVTLQQHFFEPTPFASTDVTYNGGQGNNVDYQSALNIANTAGIKQQLPWGGQVTAQALVNFVQGLNSKIDDGQSAQLALTGSIPLLRGAGPVNLEPLIQSERDLVYQVRRFEDYRRQFVVDIASRYFGLLVGQQGIVNRRFTYIVSAELTEQSYAVYAAGRPGTNFLSVQRAKQQQYTAENSIITAQDSYDSQLDDFKDVIGMPIEQPLDVVPVGLDFHPPDLEQDATAAALKYRLDLQTATDQIEDARRELAVAQNNLLPDLNFIGSTSIGNQAPEDPGYRLDGRSLQYSLGVNLNYPLDRVAERNAYRKALISLERSQRSWQQTRDSIVSQVREAIRSIRSARATLEIQQRSIDLARAQLDYANELLVLGRATDSRDSVDAQNDLLSAQDRYDQAKANYQIQILNYLRDSGTLRIDPQAGALGLALDRGSQKSQ